jgi:hypothetical protein
MDNSVSMKNISEVNRAIINILADSVIAGKETDTETVMRFTQMPEAIETIRGHQLSALIYHSLKGMGSDITGQPMFQLLKQEYLTAVAMSMLRQSHIAVILQELTANEIDVIVMKGARLAESVYPNSILRPYTDIDILIRLNQWDKVVECLGSIGYSGRYLKDGKLRPRLIKEVMYEHELDFYCKGKINVDAKFDLLELGIAMKTIDDVWDSAINTTVAGVQCKALSPEYELIHLLVHLNRHGFVKLMWCVDIALLVKNTQIDWGEVKRIAIKENIFPSIYFGLYYVREMMGKGLISDNILQEFKPNVIQSVIWRKMWPESDIYGFKGAHEADLIFRRKLFGFNLPINILLTGRPMPKLKYFARRVWPDKAYLEARYSNGTGNHSRMSLLGRRITNIFTISDLKSKKRHA